MAVGRGGSGGLKAGSIVEGEATEASAADGGVVGVEGLAIGHDDSHALVIDELEIGEALVADISGLLCAVGDIEGGGVSGGVCGDCNGLAHAIEETVQLEPRRTSVADEVRPHCLAISGEGGTKPVLTHEEARSALLADSVGELGASGVIALAEELGIQGEATSAGGASCGSLCEAVGVAALPVLQLEAEIAGEADTALQVVGDAEN